MLQTRVWHVPAAVFSVGEAKLVSTELLATTHGVRVVIMLILLFLSSGRAASNGGGRGGWRATEQQRLLIRFHCKATYLPPLSKCRDYHWWTDLIFFFSKLEVVTKQTWCFFFCQLIQCDCWLQVQMLLLTIHPIIHSTHFGLIQFNSLLQMCISSTV